MDTFKYNDYTTVVKTPFTEIKKIDMALCKQPKQTLDAFYNSCDVKPDLLINGGFFNMSDGTTCFTYIDEGQTISLNEECRHGIGIEGDKTLVYGTFIDCINCRDFICGFPVYIENYQPTIITLAKSLNYNARRSILAFDPNYLYLVAIDKPGMAYKAIQNMLVNLGVQYAINLDGGGSTRLLQNGKCITNGNENRAVDNVVAVYLNKETIATENKILYRTQIGAYSQRANAETMLAKVKALGGIYENAYVKNVEGLWKVQAGCFAVKANAERMRDDLKSKGFNCFITTK